MDATPSPEGVTGYERFLSDLEARIPLDEYPEAEVIRNVTFEERGSILAECINQAGFAAKSTSMSFEVEAAEGQSDAMLRAIYTCEASYPPHPVHFDPYSDEQLAIIYEWISDEYVPCVKAAGIVVDDMPSLETFIHESHVNGGVAPPIADLGPGNNWNLDAQACVSLPDQALIDHYEANQGSS
ncbi:hypothetical protein GCM10027591_05220 [Zhihengliuella somnathii]